MPIDAQSLLVIPVPIMEFVDREITSERRLTDAAIALTRQLITQLEKVLDERLASSKEAQVLAYAELQRRLTELNHAHQQMVDDREKNLPRESFEKSFKPDFDKWRDTVNNTLTNMQSGSTAVRGTANWIWVAGLGLLMTISTLGILFIAVLSYMRK